MVGIPSKSVKTLIMPYFAVIYDPLAVMGN